MILAQHNELDAFGALLSAPTVETLALYTGRFFDMVTGLQYNRARWYDASVGCWMSTDPIGFAAADANLYRYVNNGVTWQVDPEGLDACKLSEPLETVALSKLSVKALGIVEIKFEVGVGTSPSSARVEWAQYLVCKATQRIVAKYTCECSAGEHPCYMDAKRVSIKGKVELPTNAGRADKVL